MGNWVSCQRSKKKKGTLSKNRIQRLEVLPGWEWNRFDAVWENPTPCYLTFPMSHTPKAVLGSPSVRIARAKSASSTRPTGGFEFRQRARKGESWQNKQFRRPIGPLRRVWGHIDISGLSLMVGLADGWHPSYRRCPRRQRGESSNPFEDRSVQPTRDRHLRHLEGYVLGMPNHFGPDLDQLFPQGRHRPGLHGTWQNQSA